MKSCFKGEMYHFNGVGISSFEKASDLKKKLHSYQRRVLVKSADITILQDLFKFEARCQKDIYHSGDFEKILSLDI